VESITRWWYCVGKYTFPQATKLLIPYDCGGSNGYKNNLWKFRLAHLAAQTGLAIHVCHFPPGTSKWNKVEHRLFCYISKNWQGKPLIDVKTAIRLIGSNTTSTGLKVICCRGDRVYKTAQSVSDEEYASIPLTRIVPFECWNYDFESFIIFVSYYFTVHSALSFGDQVRGTRLSFGYYHVSARIGGGNR
jgi:hypothetical protein